jgi:hypothetical protein
MKLDHDPEIWRSANELVRLYGRAADYQAALRAARHLIRADIEAHETWMQVVRTIILLEGPSRSKH